MDREIGLWFLVLQEKLRDNKEYGVLIAEHGRRSDDLIRQLDTMKKEQKDAVLDYLGVLIELHLKQLEYALASGECSCGVHSFAADTEKAPL